MIAGNHDGFFESGFPKNQKEAATLQEVRSFLLEQAEMEAPDFKYLCDSGMEFEGYKIWGSPWTSWFHGIHPLCKAFTKKNDEQLANKWALIPDDTDILITHSPLLGFFDTVDEHRYVGSPSLRNEVMSRIKPKLHCFGHIHEWGGRGINTTTTTFVNASIMDENYNPVNKPVRVIL
jgi:Icc-related predicted phosphoesterase